MIQNTFYLVYSGHWDRDKGQDYGRLSLNCTEQGNLAIWIATTSTAIRQQYDNQFKLYGCIPANNCTKDRKYHILTKPEDSSRVKGVEGNFYRIYPYTVNTTKGTKRTALGIHKDAGVTGSLGCIVLSPGRFFSFEYNMEVLRKQGITQIPLQVQYS